MVRQLVYLVGAPGAGKSSLMRELTASWTRVPAPEGLRRDYLLNPQTSALEAVELGRRRAHFSGTDAMGQAVIQFAIPWMIRQTETSLVFGEGARLGNRRFLSSCAAAGYAVVLGHLEHSLISSWRVARERELGRAQNSSWITGRGTAARNLAADPGPGVTVLTGSPDTLKWEIEGLIEARRQL